MTQDLTNYTTDYYDRDIPENWFRRNGLFRPDQLAIICYLYNVPFWGSEPYAVRDPSPIVSIGAGRGDLEKFLEDRGERVIAVDPSAGARQLYRGSNLVPSVFEVDFTDVRSVIFCESIEHLPLDQTRHVRKSLFPGTRMIVANWPSYHPIVPDPVGDGWDHITRVDDELFSELAKGAEVYLQRASHLVLDILTREV